MTITQTASRNVAFKTARMSESVVESHDEVIVVIVRKRRQMWKGVTAMIIIRQLFR